MSSKVKTWVSDNLHDVLGYSDAGIADFAVALAGKASSASDLARQLVAIDFPDGAKTAQFAAQLLAKAAGTATYGEDSPYSTKAAGDRRTVYDMGTAGDRSTVYETTGING